MTGPVLSTFLRRVLAVFTISGANFYDFDRACSAKLNRNQMHNEQNILEDCSANFKSSNCSKYIFCTPRDSLSSLYVTFKSVLEPIVCCGSVFQSATLAYFYASLSHSVCLLFCGLTYSGVQNVALPSDTCMDCNNRGR